MTAEASASPAGSAESITVNAARIERAELRALDDAVVQYADQRKLGDLSERAFRRVKGAPIVPGSTQVALAPPKRPGQNKAVP